METVVKDQDLDKQLGGCMAGFFNIFDRPHLLSPKRLSSSSSPVTSLPSEPASETSSPLTSGNQKQHIFYATPELRSPAPDENLKGSRSPWRFSKEAPRLSLDSRAVVDAKGSLKPTEGGSPSVIARLMGLEALPQQPLQRSASESRVSREYRFVDGFNFQTPQLRDEDPALPPQRHLVRRKIFFDSGDFFPEPRQIHGGMEKAPSDLETLEQLLEALRLKGLLHSSNKQQSGNDNQESPVKPARSPVGIRSGGDTRDQTKARKSPKRRPSPEQQRRVSPLPWRRPEAVQTMWKVDEFNRQGKTLLERCDKLLHSIAEMAVVAEAGDSQPSPVSVLDAKLYQEESSTSPVMKRSLHFAESEDEWIDSEYVYISDILRASDCLPQESDIFSLLEKQQYLKGICASRAAAQERRLIFDAVQEIVGRRRRLPPWRMVGESDKMQVIWSEFQKVRTKRSSSSTEEEDVVGYVCGVIGRDLSEDRWRDCQVEMSEAVLDVERLIFKDLIGETIRHMAALNRSDSLRRRLLF